MSILFNISIFGTQAPRRRLAACLIAGLALLLIDVDDCGAQSPPPHIITLWIDGERIPMLRDAAADEVDREAVEAVDSLREEGFYFARIDSVVTRPDETDAYLSRGPLVAVGEVILEGATRLSERELIRLMETRAGRILSEGVLESDIAAILARYERSGLPMAVVSVAAIEFVESEPPRLRLRLLIDEGPFPRLQRLELTGSTRTSPAFVTRLARLEIGRPLIGYDPDEIRRRLAETGFFDEIGEPDLVMAADSAAVLRLALKDADPGSFDLLLGYLPANEGRSSDRVVGSGHLELQNLFGTGRFVSFRLNRLPNEASTIEARAGDPFLLGRPLQVEGAFKGAQYDSTYGKQAYRGEIGYRFHSGLNIFGTYSREVTRPGQAGIRLDFGRQRVPRSEAWFGGIGIRFRKLDRLVNPTRGLSIETNLESGRKERSERRIVDGDTTAQRTRLRQERLTASARLFLPALRRQVLVFGGDAGILLSTEYDRSDLFRFGGATSLRGYDEDRFQGRIIARVLAEYRFRLDPLSFAYLFFDLGYVDQPQGPGLHAMSGFHPGYGFGIQLRTAVGLINVSAGMNPDDGPTEARIHAGLSFGL